MWNRQMDPLFTRSVTRWVISLAEMSFQSRLSPLARGSSHWGTRSLGILLLDFDQVGKTGDISIEIGVPVAA